MCGGQPRNAPQFTADALKTISHPLDFVGLNVHNSVWVRADSSKEHGYNIVANPSDYPHMDPPWIAVGPEAVFWVPTLAHRICPCRLHGTPATRLK
jgi:beta-glucosidase